MELTGKEMTIFLEELQEELNEKGVEVFGEDCCGEEVLFDWVIENEDIIQLFELDGEGIEYDQISVSLSESRKNIIIEFYNSENSTSETVWTDPIDSEVFKFWYEKYEGSE